VIEDPERPLWALPPAAWGLGVEPDGYVDHDCSDNETAPDIHDFNRKPPKKPGP
jgi:hypothetical protein